MNLEQLQKAARAAYFNACLRRVDDGELMHPDEAKKRWDDPSFADEREAWVADVRVVIEAYYTWAIDGVANGKPQWDDTSRASYVWFQAWHDDLATIICAYHNNSYIIDSLRDELKANVERQAQLIKQIEALS
jgi:hypothetical protein